MGNEIELRRRLQISVKILYGIDLAEFDIIHAKKKVLIVPYVKRDMENLYGFVRWRNEDTGIYSGYPEFRQCRIDLKPFWFPERNIPLTWVGYAEIEGKHVIAYI